MLEDIYFMKSNTSQHAHKKRKMCPSCWRTNAETEFYEEAKGYEWQHCQRCMLCERKYQQDFLGKYPNTKLDHKLEPLTEEELNFYNYLMKENRNFNDE